MNPMHMPIARPTNLDALKRRFARGELSIDQLEHQIGLLMAAGTQFDPAPPLRLVRPASSHYTGDTAA